VVNGAANRRVLAADVGGTAIKLGAVSFSPAPTVAARRSIPTDSDLDFGDAMERLAGGLRDVAADAGWDLDAVDGAGLGIPGLVRRDGRLLFAPHLQAWIGRDVPRALSRVLGLSVHADNDANAFARAEWQFGAGAGSRDAVFLTLGTGIGGGLVADGRLLRGRSGLAGEPGHATIVVDGKPCPCGSRGCAERYVGNEAITRRAAESPALRRELGEAPEPRAVYEAAERGSEAAREVWRETGRYLGALLVTLANVLDPERFVIGGGVAGAGEWLLGPAREQLLTTSLVARHDPPQVIAAGLGDGAGMVGAASLVPPPDSA